MVDRTRYIFVTGGVTSSLGKGIVSASLAKLLQARGYSVTIQKLDPYINVDPGTLNPYEHGECYVTEDGAETDLDLGHYERFLNIPTSQANNITTGRIYRSVIEKERKGEFLGKTVQVIPHITDEIKRSVQKLGNSGDYDIVITEIGGTVGDIESLPYIEALRQMKWELGDDLLIVHLTLVPFLNAAGELKTKPTQHSVKALLELGVQPEVLVCRAEQDLGPDIKNKVAQFCNVKSESVIQSLDASSIYDVPLLMYDEGFDRVAIDHLKLNAEQEPHLDAWRDFLHRSKNPQQKVRIGLVGKYTELKDAYKSIAEALDHAGTVNECKVELEWIHSETLPEEDLHQQLSHLDAILVAPGFGSRGIEGKLRTIEYARVNQIPFFGICFGMQFAVIEFARNVLGLKGANTTEVDKETLHPVIHLMEDQKGIDRKGGTMRLGAYRCRLEPETLAGRVYGQEAVRERHRHRYEFNNEHLQGFEEAGMIASGMNPDKELVEIMELKEHPWFIGVQFHPEYKSTVAEPHPLFISFVHHAVSTREPVSG